jgi:hypothetical protein
MKMESVTSDVKKFVENSLCNLKNIPSGFGVYIVRIIY